MIVTDTTIYYELEQEGYYTGNKELMFKDFMITLSYKGIEVTWPDGPLIIYRIIIDDDIEHGEYFNSFMLGHTIVQVVEAGQGYILLKFD